eukprot:EG_transcript_27715
MANLPRPLDVTQATTPPPSKELLKLMNKKLESLEAKAQWPGIRYQGEADVLTSVNRRLWGYGATACAAVFFGFRQLQGYVGPISFTKTPVLFGLQIALSTAAIILINERLDRQLMPSLSEVEGRSLILEELCPHYLPNKDFYKGQVFATTFEACEHYCRRHGIYDDIMKSQK